MKFPNVRRFALYSRNNIPASFARNAKATARAAAVFAWRVFDLLAGCVALIPCALGGLAFALVADLMENRR